MVTLTVMDTCSKGGHEFTEANTRIDSNGKRRCRECLADWKRNHVMPPCSLGGCDEPVRAKQLCSKHYRAWQEYGDPLGPPAEDRHLPGERWLPVVGWEGLYEVSSAGRVWSVRGRRLLRPSINGYGYPEVALCWNSKSPEGIQLNTPVHRIEAAAFLGKRPGTMGVRHLDGDCTNNALENLKYGTQRENMDDAIEHGTHLSVLVNAEMAVRESCVNEHTYEPGSFYFNGSGSKICRICDREKIERYRLRKAARNSGPPS